MLWPSQVVFGSSTREPGHAGTQRSARSSTVRGAPESSLTAKRRPIAMRGDEMRWLRTANSRLAFAVGSRADLSGVAPAQETAALPTGRPAGLAR